MAFDAAAAQADGYSQQEIADYLAKEHGFDAAGARKDGYTDDQIVTHLQDRAPAPPKPGLFSTIAHGAGAIAADVAAKTAGAVGAATDFVRDPVAATLHGVDALTGQPLGQTQQAAGAAGERTAGTFARIPTDAGNLWRHRDDPGVMDAEGLKVGLRNQSGLFALDRAPPVDQGPDYQVPQIARDLAARGQADAPKNPGIGSQVASGLVDFAPIMATAAVPFVGPAAAAAEMGGMGITNQAERAEQLNRAGTPEAYNAEAGDAAVQAGLGVVPLGSLGHLAAHFISPEIKAGLTAALARAGLTSMPGFAARGLAEAPAAVATGAAMQAGSNLATQQSGLNPQQDLGEGVADSAGNMGLVGTILGMLHGHAAPEVRFDGQAAPPPPALPQGAPLTVDPIQTAQPAENVATPAPPPAPPRRAAVQSEPEPPIVLKQPIAAFHGTKTANLTELTPGERGPFGPASYLSTHSGVAGRYGENTYPASIEPNSIFHGLGSNALGSDVNSFALWRQQTAKLVAAAAPEHAQAISDLAGKLSSGDGYPLFRQISQIVGGDAQAQALFQRAGFKGISGNVDGPEIAMFGKVPLAPATPAPPEAVAPRSPEPPLPAEPKAVAPATPEPGGETAPAKPEGNLPPPEPVTQAPLRPEPGDLADGEKLVSTPAGNKVRTRFELASAKDLKAGEGDTQNRDRTKAGTDLQVNDIVSKFDPTRLGDSAETDRGAPIVGPDNTVEVGNGRIMALNRIYDEHPEKVAAYHEHIRSMGFDPAGIDRPVLVRRRMTEMNPDQRRTFVEDSNKDAKLEMSPVERARTDAHSLDPATMALYRGGDIETQPNDGFRKAFMSRLTPQEQGAMVGDDGRMNNHGIARLESALLAHAYENPEILSKLIEARDNNIRSIGGAMLDKSGAWATLRSDIKAGDVKPEFDITKQLVQAAREISDLRNSGGNVRDHLEQTDAFNPRDPVTERLIKAFYNKGLTRAVGRDAIGDVLDKYIRRAGEQTTEPSMFGDDHTTPADLLDKILEERDGGDQAALFDKETTDASPRATRRNEGVDEGPPGEVEGEAGDRARPDDAQAGGSRDARGGRNRDAGAGEGGEEGGDRLDDRSGVSSSVKGGYQDTFAKASYTDRPSIYESAIRDTGIDPDKFRLLPTKMQLGHLTRAFTRKYGIKVKIDGGLQDRLAIDQLLDAHQNIQGMAHVLGISERAMSFGGKLSLRLMKKGNFLGVYQPHGEGGGEIGLPQRSNSFGHEWGHALDYHLLDAVGANGRGLSGAIRKEGADFQPKSVAEAFVHVLNSMFFDKAGLARQVMDLERRIEATKGEGTKKLLQAQIDNIKRGTSQSKARSDFFNGAASLDKTASDYWTSPTEMFARSFEAYVSHMAEAEGLGTEFLGKGDANYQSDAEERFRKTFPKGEERDAIFDAIGKLMVEVNREEMLGSEPAADKPGMNDLRRLTDFDHHVEQLPKGNAIKRQMDAIQNQARRRAEQAEGRAKDPKNGLQRAHDIAAELFYSMAGKLRMIEARYGSKAVREIHDKLTYEPGKPQGVTDTFSERSQALTHRNNNRVSGILKEHGLEDMPKATYRKLRDLMTGSFDEATMKKIRDGSKTPEDYEDAIREISKGAPPALVRAAADLRRVMDGTFYDARNAGIDLGYATNGFLPRILDHPLIAGNEPLFLKKAGEAYGHVFDRDVGKDAAEIMDRDNLSSFLEAAKNHGVEGVKEVRALLKQIKKFETDPENNGEPADELHAKLRELIDEMHPEVRTAWSDSSAANWLQAQKTAAPFDRNGASPENSFTKSRELTPEADKILEDFYVQDPVEAIYTYIGHNARRTAYAERFGPKGEILEKLTKQMAKEGVSLEDQNEVLHVVGLATGRNQVRASPSITVGLAALRTYVALRLLDRAVVSSLVEPITAGITAGDFRIGAKTLAASIVGTRSLAGRQRAELARAIGFVSDHLADQIQRERFGGQYGNSPRLDKLAARMFHATGLNWLTRVQREQTIAGSHAYLDHASGQVLRGEKPNASAKDLAEAKIGTVKLREYGVRDPVVFARQTRAMNRMPTVEELDSAYGRDYALATTRFVNQTIQEPNIMSRQQAATDPVGSAVYGITSFSMRFWENVMKRQMNLTGAYYQAAGAGAAAKHVALGMLPAALGLYVFQTITSTIREFLLNRPRWDTLAAQGGDALPNHLLMLGLSNTFTPGLLTPLIQGLSGVKYQRDLSNLLVGPGPGVILQDAQTMMGIGVNNSPNTNVAEHNFMKALYGLAIGPSIALGAAMMPGGEILDPIAGVAMGGSTTQSAADNFATMFTGPVARRQGNPTPPDHPLWSLGGAGGGRGGARPSTR